MDIKKINWINILHISGLIASISGIAILIIEKSINNINWGYLIVYILSAFLVISLLSLLIGLSKDFYSKFLKLLDNFYKLGLTTICII